MSTIKNITLSKMKENRTSFVYAKYLQNKNEMQNQEKEDYGKKSTTCDENNSNQQSCVEK